MNVTAFLGLGGNLGQPDEAIRQALVLLKDHPAVEVQSVSSFYQTEPVGMSFNEGVAIPWFVNAAAQVRTSLSPQELLALCLSVEHQLGRNRLPMNRGAGAASRTLDVDLLFYGDQIIRQPGLSVPHPRMHERAFTLYPMRDIAPQWRHPELGRTIESLVQALPESSGLRPLEPVANAHEFVQVYAG
jgi:2-amino-4-hydroxy-6-hydroxymethyldihydropteridine diphosphokinase